MARQIKIPGTGRQDILEDIEIAAEAYVSIRDERMALTKKEGDAKAVLAQAMKTAKRKEYRCDKIDMEVVILPGEPALKVRKVEIEAPPEEEDEQDK